MVDLSNLEHATPLTSFLVAALMGVTHVLLGPDHVTALFLLVSGVKRKQQVAENPNTFSVWKKSAMQGFRWGFGHTIGLSFMTTLFMIFRSEIPMDKVSMVSDYVVGSMMIFIGIMSLISLYRWVHRQNTRLVHLTTSSSDNDLDHPKDGLPVAVSPNSPAHNEAHDHHMTHVHSPSSIVEISTLWERFKNWRAGDTFTDSPTSAYVVGCVHGISGLSGIVYVLPALFLDDSLRLFLYMIGFFIASIASMASLAAVLGIVPGGKKKLMIMNGIAGTSVLGVGIMWIVLTYMDKLDL
jgi:hypothetical protein